MADARPRTEARSRHDRDSVIDAAVRLLDEAGLPDLTMRRLATALGVQPSALYWHFENKQSLLAAVADRIVADGVRTIPADADAPTVARGLRTALLAHRDGAEVVLSTQALGLGAGEAYDRLVRAARLADADDPDAGATVLLHYLLGHATIVQQRLQAAALGVVAADVGVEARTFEAQFSLGIRAILSGARTG